MWFQVNMEDSVGDEPLEEGKPIDKGEEANTSDNCGDDVTEEGGNSGTPSSDTTIQQSDNKEGELSHVPNEVRSIIYHTKRHLFSIRAMSSFCFRNGVIGSIGFRFQWYKSIPKKMTNCYNYDFCFPEFTLQVYMFYYLL